MHVYHISHILAHGFLNIAIWTYSIHVYEEAHSGFGAPWSTLVAFKDIQAKKNWYRNAAEIELELNKRIIPSKFGGSSLRYFDGATMAHYQVPSSAFETVHCRQQDAPADCDKRTKDSNASNETTNTTSSTVYNPVIERHGRESLHSRKYVMHNIDGWKESLLN